jgi:hypothetical protein
MDELDSLKKILQNHEARISKLENLAFKKPSEFQKSKEKTTIIDLFIELKKDGFFDQPRFRDDIAKKLEETGNIYSSDSLNAPLIKAVKSRILGRKKIDSKWGYVKR